MTKPFLTAAFLRTDEQRDRHFPLSFRTTDVQEIRMGTGQIRLTASTLTARVQGVVTQFQTKKCLSQSSSELLLADPGRADEEVRLRQPLTPNRPPKHFLLFRVATEC